MSKHADADAKLHIEGQVRGRGKLAGRNLKTADNRAPQVPPKGTNANNQYH